jgi:serine/threonine-protein kinase
VLDPEDLVADPEERSTSQTRRMGSNAGAAVEIALIKPPLEGAAPPATPAAPGGPANAVSPAEGAPGVAVSRPYIAGDLIAGKYRLTRIIGRGGMGAVWQAHNLPLDIDVAIKLIRRDRTSAGAGERLLTEARAAARLMHPSIVRVFDFGESEQGDPFIVMELLHGESLSAILRRKKRLTPTVAVQTMLPVAAGLASAHGKGIVHRDLKPDNIIIIGNENGGLLPKIVDFGIAKLLDVERGVTLVGEVLGSPDYMSPEQAKGADNVGEATDIWAFSVVLYELITGCRPFDGPNYNALIAAILTVEPLPLTAHGAGDGALAAILAHGLTKDVAERWTRMRDLGAALASWAVANGVEDDVAGNPIGKQWLSGAARRLLTVQPEGDGPRTPSSASEAQPAPAPGPAQAAFPGLLGPPPQRPAMETRVGPRRRAPRLLWIVPVLAVAAVIGTTAFVFRDRFEAIVRGPAASATAAPTADSTADPAATAPTASPSAPGSAPVDAVVDAGGAATTPGSAAPPGSARPGVIKGPRRPRAPAAPKNIRF